MAAALLVAPVFSCGGPLDNVLPADHPDPPARASGATAPRYIVTIATNTYAGAKTLSRPEADAADVERAFVEQLGFEAKDGLRLWGDEATTAAIDALIGPKGDIQGLGEDATVVLYIALHGESLACSKDSRCTWLMTRDAASSEKGIKVSALLEELAQRAPRHIIVLLDACHAGVAVGVDIKDLDYKKLVPERDATGEPVAPSDAYRPVARQSRKVLTSAGPAQDADDGSTERAGPFAESLLRGLRGEADLYPDGWLLFTELAVYLHAEVTWLTGGRQEPEFGGFLDDERGAPIIGPLLLAAGGVAGDPDALLAEAGAHVQRGEIHEAIRALRRSLSALTERALAERRAMREAEALAAAGKGAEAIAVVDRLPRSTRGGADPAQAVRRQVQARFARQTGLPAAEVARLEARAAEVGLDVARHTATAAGRARLSSSLGGVAMLVGASQVAGGLAAGARAAAGAGAEPAVVAALAGNEAVAFDAAGDAARAAAAREVEQAAAAAARAVEGSVPGEPAEVSRPTSGGPAASATAGGPPDSAEAAPLPAVEVTGEWPAMDEPFIEEDDSLDPGQRLALARAWASRVGEGSRPTIDRVERFGRLLAAVERARREGAPAAQVAAARAAVLAAMRVMFPRPAGLGDAALTGGWVALPGGEFEMGSPASEAGRDDDEVRHRVRLSAFELGEAEVTAGQFRRLVPEHRPSDAAELPAREVSWYAAAAYAAWVGARLPTEAEWEFGSRWRGPGRGLATTRYCAGDTEADLDRVGWYWGNSGISPRPVKQKADCGGLYDMHGNAYEWVADWYGRYKVPADGAPLPDPSDPLTGRVRVMRGGSFGRGAVFARSAERLGGRLWLRSGRFGFRLARPAPSPGLDP